MEQTDKVISEIQAERERQVQREGYDTEHDDQHSYGELAMAAACWACTEDIYVVHDTAILNAYPFEFANNASVRSAEDSYSYYTPSCETVKGDKDRRRQLVIAGALIVAEIERLDRVENTNGR